MLVDPTNVTTAPSSIEYLTAVRTKCPSFRTWTDEHLLRLGAALAQMAYASRDAAAVWDLSNGLGISDHEFRSVLRESLVTLYPFATIRTAPRQGE